jgi:glycosyltransferase involved in cell wall biosynthesis
MREIRVPKSREHRQAELELARGVPGVPITDIAMPRLVHLSPEYGAALAASTSGADLMIASHPYLFPLLRQTAPGPIWYEAHNVETHLKREMLPDTPTAHVLLADTEQVEREACAAAVRVMVCAKTDGPTFQRDFAVPAERIIDILSGVDLASITYTDPVTRSAQKQRLGLDDTPTLLFMGSGHKPNADALDAILGFAAACPDIRFLIVGSVCGHVAGRTIPVNVGLMGEIDDITKDTVLGIVDAALNPMAIGSGVNLKMLDYFASGVPVISTPHGARALAVEDGTHLRLCLLDDFPAALRQLQAEIGGPDLAARVAAARRLTEDCYAWPGIADRFLAAMDPAGLKT